MYGGEVRRSVYGAFSLCPNLQKIQLPSSLKILDCGGIVAPRIAMNCDQLSEIIIPDTIELRLFSSAYWPGRGGMPGIEPYLNKGFAFSEAFSGKKIRESVALQKQLSDHRLAPLTDKQGVEYYKILYRYYDRYK